jgi:protein ImuB
VTLRLDPRGEGRLPVALARPSAAAGRWMVVLREQVFSLRLEAPVAGLALEVLEAVPAPQEQLALGDRPEELRALEVALSRLAARLGDGALCTAEPLERHRPEAAYRTAAFSGRSRGGLPAAAPREKPRRRSRTADVAGPASPPLAELCRPTRLLPVPLPLVALGEGGRIAAVRCQGRTCRVLTFSPPERLAGEWWSEPFDRDYHRAVVEGLGECWIYRDGADGRLWLHGFFD